jgi:hypothetical protein
MPKTNCPKHPYQPGRAEHRWRKIGNISGFCDICHESMFGKERYEIGDYLQLAGHKNCIDEFLKTKEGKKWLTNEENEKKESENAEKIEQERLKNLVQLKVNSSIMSSCRVHSILDINKIQYNEEFDDSGNHLLFVTKENAEILQSEIYKCQREQHLRWRKYKIKKLLKRITIIIIIVIIVLFFLYNK